MALHEIKVPCLFFVYGYECILATYSEDIGGLVIWNRSSPGRIVFQFFYYQKTYSITVRYYMIPVASNNRPLPSLIWAAFNLIGRGVSIWDTFSHTPGNIRNNDTGDLACKSYHKYGEDVNLLRSLKVLFLLQQIVFI